MLEHDPEPAPSKGPYYRARYYDPQVGRFIREDPIAFDGGQNFYTYAINSSTNLTDPFGLYHLPSGVPAPSGALDIFLRCMDHCTNTDVTVTATTNGIHADKGHYLGTSVDILPPAGLSADSVFCCAGRCGAARGLNESPAQGGQKLPTTTGANYHLSLVKYLKYPNTTSVIPNRPDCKPTGKCGIKTQ